MVSIIHFTTVHSRTDTRIRLRQIRTLSRELNADVFLYVQDGLGTETCNFTNITIVDTGSRSCRRFIRMTWGGAKMLISVALKRPTVVHFHDPELVPVALIMKLFGVKVIFDVHEDLAKQVLNKSYLKLSHRKIVSNLCFVLNAISGRFFDAIVAATPQIADNFPQKKTFVVRNFPIAADYQELSGLNYDERPLAVAYVGGVSMCRGLQEMIEAIALQDASNVKLRIAGRFLDSDSREHLSSCKNKNIVQYEGWKSTEEVSKLLNECRAGLVLLHPKPNYIDSLPVKLFEYMAAGLPVIVSKFPILKGIIKDFDCGIVVDPTDSRAIAGAIQWILKNPEQARAMGKRGQDAIMSELNWEREEGNLLTIYNRLLNSSEL